MDPPLGLAHTLLFNTLVRLILYWVTEGSLLDLLSHISFIFYLFCLFFGRVTDGPLSHSLSCIAFSTLLMLVLRRMTSRPLSDLCLSISCHLSCSLFQWVQVLALMNTHVGLSLIALSICLILFFFSLLYLLFICHSSLYLALISPIPYSSLTHLFLFVISPIHLSLISLPCYHVFY